MLLVQLWWLVAAASGLSASTSTPPWSADDTTAPPPTDDVTETLPPIADATDAPTAAAAAALPTGSIRPEGLGRALSHDDEPAPWEARSTKVAGAIVEDVRRVQLETTTATTAAPTTGAIAAIVLCLLVGVTATASAGMAGYWYYRRRYTNRPQALGDAPSEAGASSADDIFRVAGAPPAPPPPPADTCEEMYSLDNDSFLTSLEAMTTPTYWTDSIRHTKL